MGWNTFDHFKKINFSVWIVTLPKDDDNWKNGKCTCPGFFKNFLKLNNYMLANILLDKKYICKHIIGLSIRLKYVRPPETAKQVLIGQKHKRGRPKQATKALIID